MFHMLTLLRSIANGNLLPNWSLPPPGRSMADVFRHIRSRAHVLVTENHPQGLICRLLADGRGTMPSKFVSYRLPFVYP